MKKSLIFVLLIFLFVSCMAYVKSKKPQNFTYYFKNENTGLDSLLKIKGYYISEPIFFTRNKDTIQFRSLLLLYKNGICITLDGDEYSINEIVRNKNRKLLMSTNVGNYILEEDTIKAQFIYLGKEFVAQYYISIQEIHYLIKTSSQIELIFKKSLSSNYIDKDKNNLRFNFYPDNARIDSTNWLLNMKWFWDEDAYKKRKDK